jgi:hypothetical protein
MAQLINKFVDAGRVCGHGRSVQREAPGQAEQRHKLWWGFSHRAVPGITALQWTARRARATTFSAVTPDVGTFVSRENDNDLVDLAGR